MPCWSLAGSPQGATVPFKGWAFSAKFCYAGTIHTGGVVFFPNVFIEHVAFFGEVFEAMKKLTFTSELFCPQKAFFGFRNSMRQGCQAMGKNERCEKYKVFKMLAVSKTVSWVFRYGKQMKAVNSWKSQGQQRRWFQKKVRSSTLPAPQNVARKRNIPKLQRLKIIKIYKASESISFVGFKFPEGSGCRPNFSQRKHVGVSICDSICVVLWNEHTSTEATIPSLNYARSIILTANCVAGQSSPHHGKECGELGDQHKATNLFEWILWKKSIHWQNLFHWCLAAWGGNLDDRSGKSDAGCHSRGSASAAKWRDYQSLSGWGLEILHDFGCSWINGYIWWWCYVLLRTRYCTSGNNYK